jgi:hypothetical protein
MAWERYQGKDLAGAEFSRKGRTFSVAEGGLAMLYPMLPASSERKHRPQIPSITINIAFSVWYSISHTSLRCVT